MGDQVSGRLSPFLRNRRFAAARPFVRDRLLDVGCGIGRLSEWSDPTSYVGIDQDQESLRLARERYPGNQFIRPEDLDPLAKFDTIVALAVIEHIANPAAFLGDLKRHLAAGGRLVLTTPHPRFDWIHTVGAKVGLFSQEAGEEHETLLDERSLRRAAEEAGLTVIHYERFLLGANQLAVLESR